MISVVFLAARAPFTLADSLERAGFRVFEALAVSEVLHLCEQEHIDIVVIAADVESPGVHDIHDKHTTLRLKPEATAKELISELWQLFPEKAVRVQ